MNLKSMIMPAIIAVVVVIAIDFVLPYKDSETGESANLKRF